MLQLKDKLNPGEILLVYENIYRECFPDEQVICTLAEFAKFHKNKLLTTLGMFDDGIPLGALTYMLLPDTKALYIAYVGVTLEHRHEGHASKLLNRLFELYPEYRMAVVEVDIPQLKYSQKDFHFWNKHQFRALDIEYTQPALANKVDVHSMWLCVCPAVECMEKTLVLKLVEELYEKGYLLRGRALQTYMKEYKKLPKVVPTIPVLAMVERQGAVPDYGGSFYGSINRR